MPDSSPRLNLFYLRTTAGRLVAGLLFVAYLSLASHPASAGYASFVINADSGRVLSEVNADTRNYPASLTKMMTLYLVFKAIRKGRLSLSDPVRISARAARQPATKLGLRIGSKITVEQAILAIVTKSANDVATALAEKMAGSERNFALKMTAQARRLGMSRTTFRNASGLPHRGQFSTARDMAKLARAILRDFPRRYHYFSTRQFYFRGKRYPNHNKLLKTYRGADGFKTGYIRSSGYNLVASVERNGRRIIGVVFGGRSARSRNAIMTKLLDKGFAKITPAVAKSKYQTRPATANKSGPKKAVSAKAGWGIQVGAYKATKPAYSIAQKAVAKAPYLLMDGYIRVVPLTKGVRSTVYRARILGLRKRQAYRACRILKRGKINCMELRMSKSLQQVADAGAN